MSLFGDTMAVCCGTPLVGTLLFDYNEWFCVRCGKAHEFLGVQRVERTDDLEAEWEANREAFRAAAEGALIPGLWKGTCEKCSLRGEGSHIEHATEDELKASEEAWVRIQRFGQEASK